MAVESAPRLAASIALHVVDGLLLKAFPSRAGWQVAIESGVESSLSELDSRIRWAVRELD